MFGSVFSEFRAAMGDLVGAFKIFDRLGEFGLVWVRLGTFRGV